MLSVVCSAQILGFDILLMKNLKPMLLEVNANPSMRIEHEYEVSDAAPLGLRLQSTPWALRLQRANPCKLLYCPRLATLEISQQSFV